MNNNLEQLKKNFNKVKDIRNKITSIFNTLEVHIKKLKETHSNFIKTNKENIFIFGLDSLLFQSKIIDIEYDDMRRLFLAINNRIYCEYYKLYKIVAEYVKNNITEKKALDLIKLTTNFPVYKDLEPFKQYDFEIIQEIHEHIILILYAIHEYIDTKQNELDAYNKQQSIGLNINNFVMTFKFNVSSTQEKFELFMSYIEFFHMLHTKYLKRFAMKMNLFYSQITNDIRFEDAPIASETKKNEIIDTIKEENIDDSLLNQLTKSVKGIVDIDEFTDSNDSNDSKNNRVSSREKKTDSTSSLESLISNGSKGLKDIFKNNVKNIMNGFKVFNPKNFTHMDNNKKELEPLQQNMELVIKPLVLDELKNVIKAKELNKIDESTEQKDNIKRFNTNTLNLNEMISPLSQEDTDELNNTLINNKLFDDLNNECESLLSPKTSNLLVSKLNELTDFETKMFTSNNLVEEQLSIYKQSFKDDELTNADKESVSNLTMDTLENRTTEEIGSKLVNEECQTETGVQKKKKKKNKKKK